MNNSRRVSVSAVIGACGIVYGDIGTSPLYAMQQSLGAAGTFNTEAVLGVLSLIFWSLAISVTLKYLTVIMRADNEGEGGILALFALAQRRLITGSTWAKVAVGLALAGTAFFFCDALITPAISVLGAVEGLEVLNPGFKSAVIPVTIAVIVVLFAYQSRGTATVASLFGPVMVVWFVVIAVIGAIPVSRHPQVLAALNPYYGLSLLVHRPQVALAIIGAVFLAITGGEALYADMGHFGKRPVRIAWFALVGPALVINYFGQGALLLELGKPVDHPLYHLVPASVLPWLVILATAAAVIASQATISGAFSMARQAVHLDLLPRLRVLQTSALEHGQIYVPIVNWLVFPAVIAFVVGVAGAIAFGIWARRRQERTGEQAPVGWVALGLVVGLPLIVYFLASQPIALAYPQKGRFNISGGLELLPEFVALLFGLVIYTGAFIAEVVRAGILAVSHGQTEAAYSLGLRPGPTLRLVVIPQAMRVIVPPLTNQYLNLTKNSSLAVFVGYPDLVQVFAGTVLNQTGQAVEVIAVTMAVYLTISLVTSLAMNWYNSRMALVER